MMEAGGEFSLMRKSKLHGFDNSKISADRLARKKTYNAVLFFLIRTSFKEEDAELL